MATPLVVDGIVGADSLPTGEILGYSDWFEISQGRIDQFADATGDYQWLHVDGDAAARGLYGRTIAHGYLTLSLVPVVLPQILDFSAFAMGVNYGCDRVRFPAPVPASSFLRASVVLDSVTEIVGGRQFGLTMTFEVQGQTKPVCVASILLRYYVTGF